MDEVVGREATNLIILLRAIEGQGRPRKEMDWFKSSSQTNIFEYIWLNVSWKDLLDHHTTVIALLAIMYIKHDSLVLALGLTWNTNYKQDVADALQFHIDATGSFHSC